MSNVLLRKAGAQVMVFSLSVATKDYIIPLRQYLVLGLFSNGGNKARDILWYLYYLKNFPGCNVVAGH